MGAGKPGRCGPDRGASILTFVHWGSTVEADGLHDRNRRYSYLVARENARRILANPALLESGRRHLERFSAGDPHQRHGYALWTALLDEGAVAVAARLTERGERGDYARDTAPSFGGLPGRVRARLLAEARSPLAEPIFGDLR